MAGVVRSSGAPHLLVACSSSHKIWTESRGSFPYSLPLSNLDPHTPVTTSLPQSYTPPSVTTATTTPQTSAWSSPSHTPTRGSHGSHTTHTSGVSDALLRCQRLVARGFPLAPPCGQVWCALAAQRDLQARTPSASSGLSRADGPDRQGVTGGSLEQT